MLYDIALMFGGMNGYISDPTNIGTTFVNGISNILTTAAINVKLDFGQSINMCRQKIIAGEYSLDKDNLLAIGTVRYGQSLDFLVKVDPAKFEPENVAMKLTWECNDKPYEFIAKEVESCDPSQFVTDIFRFETIDLMKKLG